MHPLFAVLMCAIRGEFPRPDGALDVVVPDDAGTHAVVEFTAHAIVLTDQSTSEVTVRGADGLGGSSAPDLVRWLAGPNGWIGSHDIVLFARGTGSGSLPKRPDLADHPRVRRSAKHRQDVRVHGDTAGVVTIGKGLVGRTEMSVELFDGTPHGRGEGRRLIAEGLALIGAGEVVFAQVAPGNAASLRAFESVGFTLIGAEILIKPQRN